MASARHALAWRARAALPLVVGLCLLPATASERAVDAPGVHPCAARVDAELELTDTFRLARCLQPELSAAAARVALRVAELAQAEAAWRPELSSPAAIGRTRAGAAQLDTARAGVEFHWTLLDGGARAARCRAAHAELRSARDAYAALRQQTFGRIATRYLDAVETFAAVGERERSVHRHRCSADAAQRRAQAGFSAQSDSLQARAALARAQLLLAREQSTAHQAETALGQAIGLPPEQVVRLAPGVARGEAGEVAPLAEWLALARQREPAIAAARARRQALKAAIAEAQACGAPRVELALSHQRDATQGISDATLQLRMPLHDGGRCAQHLAAAQARHAEARADLRRARQDTFGAVAAAHARAKGAAAECRAAQDWRAAARAALRSARRRYAAGLADIGELLGAQAELDEAAQAGLRGRAQWRSAELALLAAAGVLGID